MIDLPVRNTARRRGFNATADDGGKPEQDTRGRNYRGYSHRRHSAATLVLPSLEVKIGNLR